MKKTKALKDFLEDYITDSSAYEGADNYKTYLMKSGSYKKNSYPSAVRELISKSKREGAIYGESGESLDSLGLQKSGYADYLENLKDERLVLEKEKLTGSYALEQSKNQGGYISYPYQE